MGGREEREEKRGRRREEKSRGRMKMGGRDYIHNSLKIVSTTYKLLKNVQYWV